MGILKPFGNMIKNLTPSPAPKGGTTRLNERIPTNIGGTPPLDLRQFDPELAARLGFHMGWNSDLEKYTLEGFDYDRAMAVRQPRTYIHNIDTMVLGVGFTVVSYANDKRANFMIGQQQAAHNLKIGFGDTPAVDYVLCAWYQGINTYAHILPTYKGPIHAAAVAGNVTVTIVETRYY